MRTILIFGIWMGALASAAFAYGPTGHEIVGGIADKLLANTATEARLHSLIGRLTLERASVMADEIKAWDKNGPDDPQAFPRYPEHRKVDEQLREFWRANPPTHDPNSPMPSHHWFHYTDVPVLNAQKYSDGKIGRSQWDIVHMISYCVSVLRGEIPEDNPRRITKPVAVILLAHFVGDIHQPLHVGAEYFQDARAVDPDKGQPGIEDEGGNTIALHLSRGTREEMAKRSLKLHGFWDNEAVLASLADVSAATSKEQRQQMLEPAKRQLIEQLATEEPANWRVPRTVPLDHYAEAWADDILPVAQEAHERLHFVNMHSELDQDRTVATGTAEEQNSPDGVSYADWAARTVREELHKAGWRLADLLSQALTSTSTNAAPAAVATPLPTASPVVTPLPTPSVIERSPAPTPSPSASTPVRGAVYGEYPANYKEIVSAWLKANQRDDSMIEWQGEPKPADMSIGPGLHLRGYVVIFNTPENSRPKTRSVLIRNGRVISKAGF
jgi:hypothetical protein